MALVESPDVRVSPPPLGHEFTWFLRGFDQNKVTKLRPPTSETRKTTLTVPPMLTTCGEIDQLRSAGAAVEGDADVGTDDVAGMGNDDDVPGDEGAEDVELAPTAPPEP